MNESFNIDLDYLTEEERGMLSKYIESYSLVSEREEKQLSLIHI